MKFGKIFLTSILSVGVILAIIRCTKADQPSNLDRIENTTELVSTERGETAPAVSVVAGRLQFRDLPAYDSIYSKLESASPQENIAWSDSIGFKSIHYYYYKAVASTSCPSDDCATPPSLPAEYSGKVKENGESLSPLLEYGTSGWILNTKGSYVIDESLIHYTATHIISLNSTSESQLATALTTLTTNDALGIDVHETSTDRDPGACCDSRIVAPGPVTSNGRIAIREAWSEFKDESQKITSGNTTTYKLKYSHTFRFIQRKKGCGICPFNVCERANWTIKNRIQTYWTGLAFAKPNGTTVSSGGILALVDINWEWGYECDVKYTNTLINQNVSKAV